jgi:glutamate dehydrogenase (NADP+)
MLRARGDDLQGKTCVVSGAGNVAIYAIEKLQALGAKVVACSDSSGFVFHAQGLNIGTIKQLKEVERRRIADYVEHHRDAEYHAGGSIWGVPCQVALPCATQNELDEAAARQLIQNGCIAVSEGANMPTTPDGIKLFLEAKLAYGPGKAANAGGVATSALEMQQNASRDRWSFEYTEQRLRSIMSRIHDDCLATATEYGQRCNYVLGANIVAFQRLAEAMLALGII